MKLIADIINQHPAQHGWIGGMVQHGTFVASKSSHRIEMTTESTRLDKTFDAGWIPAHWIAD